MMMQLELADTWQKGKRKNDYNLLFDDWSEADMRSWYVIIVIILL